MYCLIIRQSAIVLITFGMVIFYPESSFSSAIGNVLFKICTSNKVDEVICIPQIKLCSSDFMRADPLIFLDPLLQHGKGIDRSAIS